MASYLLVRHKVRDFSQWKPVYDAHRPKREEAGLTEKNLLRGIDDPNDVTLLFEAQDIERAKAFGGSEDLRDAMQRAGVLDKPEIAFLKD